MREIVAGMIVGRSRFGWVLPDNQALELLKELGFVFLMFLSGMEIDFRSLRSKSNAIELAPAARTSAAFLRTFQFLN